WAATNGYVDDVPVEQVRRFETDLLRFVENSHPGVLRAIAEKKALTDEIIADLKRVLADFKETWRDASAAAGTARIAASGDGVRAPRAA
ncbi:hypothetical protein ABTP34_19675, partial [Acinetobacter baumannii]